MQFLPEQPNDLSNSETLRLVAQRQWKHFCYIFLASWMTIIATTAYWLVDEQEAILDKTYSANLSTSRIVAERIYSICQAANGILLHSIHDFGGNGYRLPENAAVDAKDLVADFSPEISDVLFIEENGDLASGTLSVKPHSINYADRGYFKAHRAGAELLIGAPIVGRASGKVLMPFTRKLHGPNGEFHGVLFAGIDNGVLNDTLKKAASEKGTTVALWNRDGTILARDPGGGIGQTFSNAMVLKEVSKATVGTYAAKSVITGEDELFAYSAIKGFPLVVTVGALRSAALAPWYRHFVMLVAAELIGIVTIFLFGLRDYQRTLAAAYNTEISLAAAKSANSAKTAFLANMSHEIRTPMNGIIGLVHLAKAGKMDLKVREQVEAIGVSAHRLLGILNDILDVSKIEAGQITLEKIAFAPDRLIKDVINIARSSAGTKDLNILAELAPNLPPVLLGDPLRINQMLGNLMVNAVKFTERGSIILAVKADSVGEDGSITLRFSVQDTGIGLTPEQRDKLFQPFHQADETTTRKFGGTGLGLAIVKQLATLMGGQVGVASEAGKGSCFWFTVVLGVSDGIALEADSDDGAAEAVVAEPDILRGALILLVEDDPVNRMVAVGLLEAIGIRVEIAENGAEAVAMVEQERGYEAVLMDLQMPVMDGLTATRQIRLNPKFEELPIIAMTAGVMVQDRQASVAAGMNDFVAKPVSPEQLYNTVHKWVTGLGEASLLGAKMREQIGGESLKLPSNIEGLDIRAGLRRVAGMKELYLKTLRRFLEDHSSVVEQLRLLLDKQDVRTANRVAHTLKGAAGMIEAREIYGMALAVEQVLEGGDLEAGRALIAKLDSRLTPLLEALRGALDTVAGFTR